MKKSIRKIFALTICLMLLLSQVAVAMAQTDTTVRSAFICPYCHSGSVSSQFAGNMEKQTNSLGKCHISTCNGTIFAYEKYNVYNISCNNSTCLRKSTSEIKMSTQNRCNVNASHIY